MIYFIQSGEKGPIKIGFTIDPEKRLGHLQCANPCELTLLKAIHGDMEEERRLHEKFRHLRIRGEWFKPNRVLRAYIHKASRVGTPEGPAGAAVVEAEPATIAAGFTLVESSCYVGDTLVSKTVYQTEKGGNT